MIAKRFEKVLLDIKKNHLITSKDLLFLKEEHNILVRLLRKLSKFNEQLLFTKLDSFVRNYRRFIYDVTPYVGNELDEFHWTKFGDLLISFEKELEEIDVSIKREIDMLDILKNHLEEIEKEIKK